MDKLRTSHLRMGGVGVGEVFNFILFLYWTVGHSSGGVGNWT